MLKRRKNILILTLTIILLFAIVFFLFTENYAGQTFIRGAEIQVEVSRRKITDKEKIEKIASLVKQAEKDRHGAARRFEYSLMKKEDRIGASLVLSQPSFNRSARWTVWSHPDENVTYLHTGDEEGFVTSHELIDLIKEQE